MPLVLTYSSTKAALHSLTQSTPQMLRGQGTRVAGVYPGLEEGLEEIYPDPFGKAHGDAPRR
jgi:NAD(P)-dependent dehydrogenase (short-subunit alcohol dehydrogenase family)